MYIMSIAYYYPKNDVSEFENTVFKSLSIDQTLFDKCVKKHRGYAFLLRNWIKEAYQNGASVNDVVLSIKKSSLKIEEIIIDKPLS